MPLTTSIEVSQSATTPNIITIEDTSTGSDGTITIRRVYFQTSQGTYLVQSGTSTDYEEWSYADATGSFNVLEEDMALSITVQWLAGSTVVYSLTQVYCFPQNNKNFYYYLFQQQAITPGIPQDTGYYQNLAIYWQNIIGAIQAIEIGADVANSQNALNRATNMMNNSVMYF